MTSMLSPHSAFAALARTAARSAGGWWRTVHLAARLMVLAASPSSYTRQSRVALAHHLYAGTANSLLWFSVLSTLISLIVIRIVLVTALSYGLSQYALEMVVRVLVLELIPLAAALFAALRCTIPMAAQIAVLRARSGKPKAGAPHVDLLHAEVLPRVAAGVFCALMLAAVSCVVTLVVAYLSVYGFRTSGFAAYTHTVGRVFDPSVSLIFALKILLLGVAVALMPTAAVLDEAPRGRLYTSVELEGLVRMFLVIVLIEAGALVGNYY